MSDHDKGDLTETDRKETGQTRGKEEPLPQPLGLAAHCPKVRG